MDIFHGYIIDSTRIHILVVRRYIIVIYMQMLDGRYINQHKAGVRIVMPLWRLGQVNDIVGEIPVGGSLIGIQRRVQIHLVAHIIIHDRVGIVLCSAGISKGIECAAVIDAISHQVVNKVMFYVHISLYIFKAFCPSVSDVEPGIRNVKNFIVFQIHVVGKSHRYSSTGLIIHSDVVDIVIQYIIIFHHLTQIRRIVIVCHIGIRITDANGIPGNIIEVIALNGAVLHSFHHLQTDDSQTGKCTVRE